MQQSKGCGTLLARSYEVVAAPTPPKHVASSLVVYST